MRLRAMRLWVRTRRRAAAIAGALLLTAGLSGCLYSPERIALGAAKQPLPAGRYAQVVEEGDEAEIMDAAIGEDGVYRGDKFELAFYESGLEPDLYFIAFTEFHDDETQPPRVLYGYGWVQQGAGETALAYDAVSCDNVPTEDRGRLGLTGSGSFMSCPVTDAAQIRAALTAILKARDPQAPPEMRYVLSGAAGKP